MEPRRAPTRPVSTPSCARVVAALGTCAALWTGACVDINGGAVELSWSFQTFQGNFIADDCLETRVDQVRLSWKAPSWSGSMSSGVTSFACEDFRGITDFVIAEGPQLLEIAPVCDSGVEAAPRTYEVPAPLLRNLLFGEVVTLDSLLIVIDDVESNSECACCDGAVELSRGEPRAPAGAPGRMGTDAVESAPGWVATR